MTVESSTTVWKYSLDIHNAEIIKAFEIPEGAEILCAGVEYPDPEEKRYLRYRTVAFWARVNPELPKETRQFMLLTTGHPVPDGSKYVGTIRPIPDLVFHLWETFLF